MKCLRFAVVGAGHLGRIHGRLLQQVDGAKLVAVCDPDHNARELASQQLGVPTFADPKDVLNRIDAAVIAAPTPLHTDIANQFIQAGKHLLVEKPLASVGAEARQIARLAAARRVILQVGHVERFNPAWIAAEDVLQKPKFIEAVRASRFPGRCLDVGVVMDLMIHDLDLVLSLTDAPIRDIQASGISLITDHEDLAEARVTFECGLVAQFKASRVSPEASRQLHSYGPHGFADIDFQQPSVTVIRPHDSILDRTFDLNQATDTPTAFGDELFSTLLSSETRDLQDRNPILDELHDFVISIQSRTAPTVTGAAAARAVDLADSILAAIKDRAWTVGQQSQQQGPFAIPRETIHAASRRLQNHKKAA